MSQASELLSIVADGIKKVEEKMGSGIPTQHADLQSVVDYLIGAGGKRLRPALTLMAANFYPVDHEKSYALAASVELLHTASLVHDDLIDNSLFRRGMPTLNVSWSPGATILTGDFLFARSAQLAAETDNVRIVNIFAETLMTIVGGELNQLFNDGHDRIPNQEEYHQRIYAKTASLFAAGTESGGILCNAPEAEVKSLRDYGYYLGMGFQIIDDILDFKGDEDHIGKPVANDLRQGIATLPVMLYNQQYPNHPTILKAVRRQPVSDDEILGIVDKICASGCVDASMEEAVTFVRTAQQALERLPDNQYRQAMHGLADYTVTRDI